MWVAACQEGRQQKMAVPTAQQHTRCRSTLAPVPHHMAASQVLRWWEQQQLQMALNTRVPAPLPAAPPTPHSGGGHWGWVGTWLPHRMLPAGTINQPLLTSPPSHLAYWPAPATNAASWPAHPAAAAA
jgi:hypothetical protein